MATTTKKAPKDTLKGMKKLEKTSIKLADTSATLDPIVEAVETFAKIDPEYKEKKRTRDRVCNVLKGLYKENGTLVFEGVEHLVEVSIVDGSRLDTDRLKRDLGARYEEYVVPSQVVHLKAKKRA